MAEIRVLLINCNTMLDTLVTAGIGILSACIKEAGHEVRMFDTTFYRTADVTGDQARAAALQVKETDFADLGIEAGDLGLLGGYGAIGQDAQAQALFAQLIQHVVGVLHGDGTPGKGQVPVLVDSCRSGRPGPVDASDDIGSARVGGVAIAVGPTKSLANDFGVGRIQGLAETIEERLKVGIDRARPIGQSAVEIEDDGA